MELCFRISVGTLSSSVSDIIIIEYGKCSKIQTLFFFCSQRNVGYQGLNSENASTRPLSTVGNKSDCRSRGREFNPGPIPYFHGD